MFDVHCFAVYPKNKGEPRPIRFYFCLRRLWTLDDYGGWWWCCVVFLNGLWDFTTKAEPEWLAPRKPRCGAVWFASLPHFLVWFEWRILNNLYKHPGFFKNRPREAMETMSIPVEIIVVAGRRVLLSIKPSSRWRNASGASCKLQMLSWYSCDILGFIRRHSKV